MDCLSCGEEVTGIDEFRSFPKIARLSRECIITEKINGTNAQIKIREGQIVSIGSRNRFLTEQNDNFGFARWVGQNQEELLKLGDGIHYGEWWGFGIQRGYGLFERRFSLFRVPKNLVELPQCVSVVPKLWEGIFDSRQIECILEKLKLTGSHASPGFKDPEGIVIYHKAAGIMFKKTLENDEKPKGVTNDAA